MLCKTSETSMGLESCQLNAKPRRRRHMRVNKLEIVRKMLEHNPKTKAEDVAKKLGVGKAYAYVLMSKARKTNNKPEKILQSVAVAKFKEHMEALGKVTIVEDDPVNQPAHYKVGGIETIDFIEAKKLNYNLGNVVKYITRADHKSNKLEDLRKAQWYLSREILAAK
jgi:hypothetical protein